MKFNFKLKKDNTPSLESLRQPLFDTNLYWLLTLGVAFMVVVITTVIGLKLFFNEYFESYKKKTSPTEFSGLINIERLDRAIDKRGNFVNSSALIPQDPSI